jgi:alpha-beta hydrolase superfamily lysophospholipase
MYGPARWAPRVEALALATLAVVLAVLAGCASASPRPAPPGPAARGGPRCQRETIPVAPAAPAGTGNQARYHLAGWLCADGSPRGRTVQVLIPGLTYGASYWNFPLDPGRYSYVRAATAAGFATMALDRLGTGASSHPPAADVTATAEAVALHDVVQRLRAGRVGSGPFRAAFRTVVLTGHSFGSDVALREAGTYADVAGVISTGWLTAGNPAGHLRVRDSYDASAADDPKFAEAGLPTGYVTTRPGTRGADFYQTSYASPAVIAEDEKLKQTVTSGELASVVVAVPPAVTRRIHVPVLLADGQDDALDCDPGLPGVSCASAAALITREQANYAPQACLRAFVLPRAGHSINLHPDAPQWFAAATRWIRTYVTARSRPRSCSG